MGFPPRLALATRNPHKVREILQICADWPVEWVTFDSAPIPEVEETESSYAANALLKARATATVLGIPALADDSGIEVDALGGAPGPRSARFAGPTATDAENLSLLLERLAGVPPARRTARYRCVAVCDWPGPGELARGELVAEATCEGTVIPVPRGGGGFGYDPAFVPAGMRRTMAELAPGEKHEASHRGKALRALRDMLAADRHTSARDEEPG